ncbi:MAG: hypothetical protein ACI9DS_003017, partial [Glaciecola sp.]
FGERSGSISIWPCIAQYRSLIDFDNKSVTGIFNLVR